MISVIINVYNGEKYIKKCLESVINQTYKNIEIIIVNDGSTDKTLEIIKKYKDKRIKIINQDNKGLSISRNVGLDHAKGEYVYFVDADDYIEKDAIEYLFNLAKKHKSDITTTRCVDVDNYDYVITNEKEKIEVLSNKEFLKRVLLIKYREGTIWNKLIKKELFDNNRFEEKIINDVRVTYKVVIDAKKIVYSNQIKYYYFRHNDSIISKKETKYMMDLYDAAKERYNNIKKVFPDLIENEATICLLIANMYITEDKKLLDYLNSKNARKFFKNIYNKRILACYEKKNDRLKIRLFRISPRLLNVITKIYLRNK